MIAYGLPIRDDKWLDTFVRGSRIALACARSLREPTLTVPMCSRHSLGACPRCCVPPWGVADALASGITSCTTRAATVVAVRVLLTPFAIHIRLLDEGRCSDELLAERGSDASASGHAGVSFTWHTGTARSLNAPPRRRRAHEAGGRRSGKGRDWS